MSTTLFYQPGTDHDDLLAGWYLHLRTTGDLERVFFPAMHSFSGFFQGFARTELVLACDGHTVWAAVWVEHTLGVPFLGVWIDAPYRGSLRAARFLLTWHQRTTDAYPTLLCLTRQPDVVALAQALGYTTHGEIPGLWAGASATLLSSTKESRYGRQRRRQQSHFSQPTPTD